MGKGRNSRLGVACYRDKNTNDLTAFYPSRTTVAFSVPRELPYLVLLPRIHGGQVTDGLFSADLHVALQSSR